MARYVQTLTALCDELGLSVQHLSRSYQRLQGFPEKKKEGWDVTAVQQFIADQKRRKAEKLTGPNVDLKRKRLSLECDLLTRKIETEAGKYVPIETVKDGFRDYVSITLGVLGQFRQHVEAITRDAVLLKKAQELEDELRKKLSAKLESDLAI